MSPFPPARVGRLIERALEEGQFWWPSWGLVEPAATLGRVCAWNTCARGVFLAFWSCHSFQEDALDRGLGVLFPPARHCFGTKKSKMRGVLQRAPEPIEAPLFCCLCCLLTHRPFLALLLTPYQVGQANLPTPPACGGSGCCCWPLSCYLLLQPPGRASPSMPSIRSLSRPWLCTCPAMLVHYPSPPASFCLCSHD